MGKIIEAQKLTNEYWQITILDPVTQTPQIIRDLQFYRVSNKDINLKNYPYADLDNSYLYFDKSYTPQFIAQLLYLYTRFAYTNGILDKDVLKITKLLSDEGLTMTKYGLSQINDNTILPCIQIDPYPKELAYKCLNDDGSVVDNPIEQLSNYWYVKKLVNIGHSTVTLSLWNFSYIVFCGIAMFMIIFLFVMRVDK